MYYVCVTRKSQMDPSPSATGSSSCPETGTPFEFTPKAGQSFCLAKKVRLNFTNYLCSSGPEARPAPPPRIHTHTTALHSKNSSFSPPNPAPPRYQEIHCQTHTLRMLRLFFFFKGPFLITRGHLV